MKATINPKDEFAKRHKKYHIRFDDNERYKAWLNDYIIQNEFRIPIEQNIQSKRVVLIKKSEKKTRFRKKM